MSGDTIVTDLSDYHHGLAAGRFVSGQKDCCLAGHTFLLVPSVPVIVMEH